MVFPGPPRRRSMLQNQPMFTRRPNQKESMSTPQRLAAMFQDDDGNMDFEKVTVTFKQITDIYDQISPLVSRFIKK